MSLKKKKIESALDGLFSSSRKSVRSKAGGPEKMPAIENDAAEISKEEDTEPAPLQAIKNAPTPAPEPEFEQEPVQDAAAVLSSEAEKLIASDAEEPAENKPAKVPGELSTPESILPTPATQQPAVQLKETTTVPARVDATLSPRDADKNDEMRQEVVFTLQGQFYGLDIANVEAIIKIQTITRVPHARFYVIGVTNLRGEVLPVIDLRVRFGLETSATPKDSRIIVLTLEHEKIGVLVDTVSEVLSVAAGAIEPPPPLAMTTESKFITGIAKVENRLITLLDLATILTEN